jgi:hypothetical protein
VEDQVIIIRVQVNLADLLEDLVIHHRYHLHKEILVEVQILVILPLIMEQLEVVEQVLPEEMEVLGVEDQEEQVVQIVFQDHQ